MKKIVVLVVLVILVVLGAFVYTNRSRIFSKPLGNNNLTSQNQTENNKPGVWESIKDAMSQSLSLKCEYNSVDSKSTVYIKGQNIRMDGSWKGSKNSSTIIKDGKIWTWDTDTKQGIVMQIPPKEQTNNQNVNPEQIINDLENQKQNCQAAVVLDSAFVFPTDVTFADMTELLNKVKNTTPGETPVVSVDNETGSGVTQ